MPFANGMIHIRGKNLWFVNFEKADNISHELKSRERIAHHVIIGDVGHGDDHVRMKSHGATRSRHGSVVASPAAASDAVVDVPQHHLVYMPARLGAAVDNHTESAVDDFAPSDAAAVVQRHPGGSAKSVADDILHGHIRGKGRAVINIDVSR